jgi:hypothetical protein
VTATSGNGIFALTTGGNVTVKAGDVGSTGNTAIVAQQALAGGAGNIKVTTGGNVSGTNGIVAQNNGTGNVSITVGGNVAAMAGVGVSAVNANAVANAGTIDVTLATGKAITTVGGNGIFTDSGLSNGMTTVKVDGSIAASDNGVAAVATAGDIKVVGAGSVTGNGAGKAGILAITNSGKVDVAFVGTAAGAGDGIRAQSTSGAVGVTGTGAVTATTGYGILGTSVSGNVSIAAGAAVTSTGGEAIRGQSTGGGNVTITTAGTATGGTIGVRAITNTGLATITTNAAVVGNAMGVLGQATGSGSVAINANAKVSTSAGHGVAALLQGAGAGTITVNQGPGSLITATNGSGIWTDSGTSTGATTITVAGEIKATGAGNVGIRGISTTGAITVNVTATGKVDPDFGIALNTVSGALNVNNAGLVTGNVAGVQLVATGAGTANLVNSGTITGPNAIVGNLNGGAFAINNSGTLNGAFNVSGSNVATSLFSNLAGGTANLGSGASAFSGSFNNAGIVNIGAGGTVGFAGSTVNSNRINFAGAGTFTTMGAMTNTGIINAQNNLTTNVVNVGGTYTGGGQFFADYSTTTATADRLNIAGSVSGTTNVTMNLVGPRTFVPGGFLPVVVVTPGAAANAFTSNTVFATSGFILDSFGRNPANNTQFGVIQQINPAALPLGNLNFMAESASALLDEPVLPYITRRTDAGGTRFSLWLRAASGHTRQQIATTITGGGVSLSSSGEIRTVHQAIQGGADLGIGLGGAWILHVGLTGGIYDGASRFSSTDRIGVDAEFAGAYFAIGDGNFMLDGTIRKEWRTYDIASPSLFGTAALRKLDGSATAGSAHASYRLGGKTGFAATPFVGFNYADNQVDDLPIDAFSFYSPGDHTTKVGQAGLRLSYRFGSDERVVVEPFAGAAALKNWSNTNGGSFSFAAPATVFAINASTWDDAIRYSAGISAKAHDGRVSAFIVGNLDDSSDRKSFTMSGGLRLNF